MQDHKPIPPGLWLRFFRWFCHPRLVDHIEGDLIEAYAQHVNCNGKRKAYIRFVVDVLLLLRPGIVRPVEGYGNLDQYGMIRNYFKIGWRNIVQRRLYSAINAFGLALGICACLVIYTIVQYEFSFDSFHADGKRIYRVVGDLTESTGNKLHFGKLPIPLLEGARTATSAEVVTGVIPFHTNIKIKEGNRINEFDGNIAGTRNITVVIAEPRYFDVFKYKWLAGASGRALREPLSVVLTESRARQYFGLIPPEQMLGKPVVYEDSLLATVTGIIKDWSGNSDLAFTDFISFGTLQTKSLKGRFSAGSWKQGDLTCWIYARIPEGVAPKGIEDQLAAITKPHAEEIKLTPRLEPLSNIHFNNDVIENPIRTAHLPTLFSLITIAIFILLLAIINFVNLSTAQSLQRAKEVGIRKVLGSSSWSLSVQFLTEAFLLTLIAGLLAVPLVDPVLHEFSSFVPAGVSFHVFGSSILSFLILIVLATTLLSGFYPARVLSSHLPAINLKGVGTKTGKEGWMLRKGLIVFQFSVSLVFIIGSIVISKQLKYTRHKDLGFNADAIVLLETPGGDRIDKISSLSERVKRIHGVDNVALQWVPPMALNGRGRNIKFKRSDEKTVGVTQVAGNEDFLSVYQIKLLAGRNLVHSDSLREFVINENLSRLMGCKKPEDALGRMLYWDDKPYPVVGVVADFHSRSLHETISPLCIVNRPDREGTLAIKLSSRGPMRIAAETLIEIEKAWKEVYPEAIFKYIFYDDTLASMYESDQRIEMLVNTAQAIAIIISCIGLFGLTLFASERRAKEVSIRKILGANILGIALMLSRDLVVLVVVAVVIASPVALYFAHQWLQGFAYHISVSWDVYALAGSSCLLITMLTVSYQSIKAALSNPVDSLRSE